MTESDTDSDIDLSLYHLTRNDIESITSLRPIDISYYCQAFVHKSIQRSAARCINALDYTHQSYERFEYLGDSVLNLVVANYLFSRYPNQNEGFLTKLRTKLVNGKTLSKFSRSLNLGKYILMNSNVERISGRDNDRMLEDVFESLVCAIFLDLGLSSVTKFILSVIEKEIDFCAAEVDDNYKDILLRFCQQKMGTTPDYKVHSEDSDKLGCHNKIFKITCVIDGINYKFGNGKSKKTAEQQAAKETLIYFGVVY